MAWMSRLKMEGAELSNEALQYVGEHITEALLSFRAVDVRNALWRLIIRADLFRDRLRTKCMPLPASLLLSGVSGQCPQGNSNPCFGLERAAS